MPISNPLVNTRSEICTHKKFAVVLVLYQSNTAIGWIREQNAKWRRIRWAVV